MYLSHTPGHAQADFGEALVDIGGVRVKAHFLVMDLPYCDAYFVKAYPGETTEASCDAHNSSFAIGQRGGHCCCSLHCLHILVVL